MFRDMFLKIRVFELFDERPDHHEENKQPKPGVDDEPNRAAANEGGRFFLISWSSVHRFMGSHGGVMHNAAHRSNVNWRESREVTGFPLLISVIKEVRYTEFVPALWCSGGTVMISGSKQGNNQRRWILAVWLLAVGSGLFMPLASMEALATTMYSYIDEQGTPVITDNFNTIPERYRARVKTTELTSTAPQRTSTAGAIHERVTNWGRQFRDMASGAAPNISGLSRSQSQILTYAGLAAIVLLVAMNLSKGQMVRLLAMWCLLMLALGTPVLLYISDDGPADVMKSKAAAIEGKQEERLKQAQ